MPEKEECPYISSNPGTCILFEKVDSIEKNCIGVSTEIKTNIKWLDRKWSLTLLIEASSLALILTKLAGLW